MQHQHHNVSGFTVSWPSYSQCGRTLGEIHLLLSVWAATSPQPPGTGPREVRGHSNILIPFSRENCPVSAHEVKLLAEMFNLQADKINKVYTQFQSATKGEKSLTRRKFSDIMHQCFPRTHKVDWAVHSDKNRGVTMMIIAMSGINNSYLILFNPSQSNHYDVVLILNNTVRLVGLSTLSPCYILTTDTLSPCYILTTRTLSPCYILTTRTLYAQLTACFANWLTGWQACFACNVNALHSIPHLLLIWSDRADGRPLNITIQSPE